MLYGIANPILSKTATSAIKPLRLKRGFSFPHQYQPHIISSSSIRVIRHPGNFPITSQPGTGGMGSVYSEGADALLEKLMHHLLEALFDFCIFGLYRWLGRQIYGPGFVDQDTKQPLHRRMMVSIIAFFITLGIALIFVFLII